MSWFLPLRFITRKGALAPFVTDLNRFATGVAMGAGVDPWWFALSTRLLESPEAATALAKALRLRVPLSLLADSTAAVSATDANALLRLEGNMRLKPLAAVRARVFLYEFTPLSTREPEIEWEVGTVWRRRLIADYFIATRK
jgi:hypothetical protein